MYVGCRERHIYICVEFCAVTLTPLTLTLALHVPSPFWQTKKQVLTEPKNALIKQYREIFRMSDVGFHVTRGGLEAIAHLAKEVL
jgi:hypothetical protein